MGSLYHPYLSLCAYDVTNSSYGDGKRQKSASVNCGKVRCGVILPVRWQL